MPIFYQQQINPSTRLGIWKIAESEEFFQENVPLHREVTHPHKRLQHLAGRFLLQYLFPAFPYELIRLADTRKPFLPDEQYHFSISHCGDYAAAIVSRDARVGIDVELCAPKVDVIKSKFLSATELSYYHITEAGVPDLEELTMLWSAKESVYKWYGAGKVDFSDHIRLEHIDREREEIHSFFTKTGERLVIHYRRFNQLVLAWTTSVR